MSVIKSSAMTQHITQQADYVAHVAAFHQVNGFIVLKCLQDLFFAASATNNGPRFDNEKWPVQKALGVITNVALIDIEQRRRNSHHDQLLVSRAAPR